VSVVLSELCSAGQRDETSFYFLRDLTRLRTEIQKLREVRVRGEGKGSPWVLKSLQFGLLTPKSNKSEVPRKLAGITMNKHLVGIYLHILTPSNISSVGTRRQRTRTGSPSALRGGIEKSRNLSLSYAPDSLFTYKENSLKWGYLEWKSFPLLKYTTKNPVLLPISIITQLPSYQISSYIPTVMSRNDFLSLFCLDNCVSGFFSKSLLTYQDQ